MKQLAIMFSYVLRSKHVVPLWLAWETAMMMKKILDGGWFLSTYSRSVTIIVLES